MHIDLNKTFTIDIESNNLLADSIDYTSFPYKLKDSARLWCIALYNIGTGHTHKAENENITKEWLSSVLANCSVLISHNGIKFDLLLLYLFGILDYEVAYPEEVKSTVAGNKITLIDTLILSRLFNPDRFGGHSLDSWGQRLGYHKIHWREEAIELGLIDKDSPKGAEFAQHHPKMTEYCIRDNEVTAKTFLELKKELDQYPEWTNALLMEHKLADLAIRRETLGFGFDKELADKCVIDLDNKLEELANKVNPILPKRSLKKGEINDVTPPKRQLTIKNQPTSDIKRFAEKHGYEIDQMNDEWYMGVYKLPHNEPLETEVATTIDDLDHVKMYLISLGWEPSEWKERDLTKDSKKQSISYEKRIKALEKWFEETINGKYKEQRLKLLDMKEGEILPKLKKRLREDKPVRVSTSPSIRVGVEKELCPNLVKLGDEVAFAKDFAMYLTYKHRKSSICGGTLDEDGEPTTGFLSMYREEDGRIPTPAIEIGASTGRYRHIGVCNIARATSIYGKEMRSLFTSGDDFLQLGFDFASLEARIEGHYVFKYTDGITLAESLIAEKPFDVHTITSKALGIPRVDAKSVNYAILYGAQVKKIMKMLACSKERAEEILNGFWSTMPSLRELKENLEKYWFSTGKKYILGIDGRKVMTRSQHSLLNALFQSAGVIAAKYTTVYLFKYLEELKLQTNPFKGKPDVCNMIDYHDEVQLAVNSDLIRFKTFSSEEDAKEYVNTNNSVGQYSAISKGNKWYVAEPNLISENIGKAIDYTTKLLKLNVPLGYEWIVNKNWYGCH